MHEELQIIVEETVPTIVILLILTWWEGLRKLETPE
jgi:hypothetical protein